MIGIMVYYKDFDFTSYFKSVKYVKHKSGGDGHGKKRYRDSIITFDVETSNVKWKIATLAV